MRVTAKRVERSVSRSEWYVSRHACGLSLVVGLVVSVASCAALVRGGMDCQKAAALSVLVAYLVAGVAYLAAGVACCAMSSKRGGK